MNHCTLFAYAGHQIKTIVGKNLGKSGKQGDSCLKSKKYEDLGAAVIDHTKNLGVLALS